MKKESKANEIKDLTSEVEILKNYYDNELKIDAHGRYLSWEYCYKVFCEARNKENDANNIDYLSLALGFYLANWGMNRNSFLLKKDYKIHNDVVKEVLKKKYDCLIGISIDKMNEDSLGLIMELYKWIKAKYDIIRKEDLGKGNHPKNDLSDILVTKVLLGTLGCCPAYDNMLKKGLKYCGCTQKFGKKSLQNTIDLYKKNENVLKWFKKIISGDREFTYPDMKVIDMLLWKTGFDKWIEEEEEKKRQKEEKE